MGLLAGIRRWMSRASGGTQSSLAARTPRNWEGIYPRFRDVPVVGAGFEDDTWARDTRNLTQGALAACKARATLPPVSSDDALLPFLAGIAAQDARKKLTVLDFGGGLGVSYVHLLSAAAGCGNVEYHVVETERLCTEGTDLFRGDAGIRFHSRVPDSLPELDIVYANSALQYFENYPELLGQLCGLSPRFILLVRCSAGEVPTYATAQVTLPGKSIPYWFLNIGDLTSILERRGYRPLFKATSATALDMSNFPPTYRLQFPCNLLFGRM